MSEYIVTKEQIEELNKAHGGMKIVTSWLSCYAIWDTSNTYPLMKSEHVAVDLPEIVRCRDCARCQEYTSYERTWPEITEYEAYWCSKFAETVNLGGFCAWGVRADE